MSERGSRASDSDPIAHRIVREVARVEDIDATDVKPLHESVEAQALGDILNRSDSAVRVDFVHQGRRIIVERTNELEITVL